MYMAVKAHTFLVLSYNRYSIDLQDLIALSERTSYKTVWESVNKKGKGRHMILNLPPLDDHAVTDLVHHQPSTFVGQLGSKATPNEIVVSHPPPAHSSDHCPV